MSFPESLVEIDSFMTDFFKFKPIQLLLFESFFIQMLHGPQVVLPQNSSFIIDDKDIFLSKCVGN